MIQIKSAFFMAISVILCCCVCGCINDGLQKGNQSTATPIGVTDRTPRNNELKVPLEAAMANLESANSSGTINISGMTIHFLHGVAVNLDGNASTWVVGIKRYNESSLLMFSLRDGWQQIRWDLAIKEPEIVLQELMMPTDLFRKNHQLIQNASTSSGSSECQLDLLDDRYVVSFNAGGNISTMSFNATTGELVTSIN